MGRTACTEPQCLYSRAILLSLWAIRPVQSLSACTRVHFTFTFKGQAIKNSPWTAGPLNKGPTGCYETSVTNHQSMLCNIPEEQRPHTVVEAWNEAYICEPTIRQNWYQASLTSCSELFNYSTSTARCSLLASNNTAWSTALHEIKSVHWGACGPLQKQ